MYEVFASNPSDGASFLRALNCLVGESGRILDQDALGSVWASTDYYTSNTDRVFSVARSIMQNHPFVDGNKRTGCIYIQMMLELLHKDIGKITDDEWVEFAVRSVTERWDVNKMRLWFYQRL
jgi:prophage maintenance system killer protein